MIVGGEVKEDWVWNVDGVAGLGVFDERVFGLDLV